MPFTLSQLKSDIIINSKGRNWQWRFPFLLWFLYILVRYLLNPGYTCILSALNLGIHEFGHLIFSLFGQFMAILGATFFQIFIPLFAVFNFCRQKDFFSAALSFGWLSTNLFEISYYVADANKQMIMLVSPFGENVIHDWAYILEKTGLLRYDLLLSSTFRLLGVVAMLFCFLSGIWILRHMAAAKIEKC